MFSIDELQKTWYLASKLHNGQKYGGQKEGEQVEYINHIGSVTFEVLAAIAQTTGINADLAMKCAILHDTIEDTPFCYEEVIQHFGKEVADGVLALTKNDQIKGKEAKMKDSLQRIKAQPQEIWAVKMADRICNLSAPPYYWTKEKKQKYQQEAQLIYEELKEGNLYLAKRLAKKIEAYKRYFD